jgi:hypothetical protein
MSKCYRVIFETYDKSCPEKTLSKKEIIEDELKKPNNCLDFGMGFSNQLTALEGIQRCTSRKNKIVTRKPKHVSKMRK